MVLSRYLLQRIPLQNGLQKFLLYRLYLGTQKHPKMSIELLKVGFSRLKTTLGIHHAVSTKKNLFLVAGAFALTIVLLLSFSACLDVVRCLLPSLSDFSPDITIASQEDTNSIDKNLTAEIAELPGVEDAFGTMYEIKIPAEINGNETMIDLMSYEEFMLKSTKKSVASGDLSKVYGDTNYALTIFSQ